MYRGSDAGHIQGQQLSTIGDGYIDARIGAHEIAFADTAVDAGTKLESRTAPCGSPAGAGCLAGASSIIAFACLCPSPTAFIRSRAGVDSLCLWHVGADAAASGVAIGFDGVLRDTACIYDRAIEELGFIALGDGQ